MPQNPLPKAVAEAAAAAAARAGNTTEMVQLTPPANAPTVGCVAVLDSADRATTHVRTYIGAEEFHRRTVEEHHAFILAV